MLKQKIKSGFTLVELIAVIALLSILVGSMISYQNTGERKKEEFIQEIDTIGLLFQEIRNYAITNKVLDWDSDGNGEVPEGGYGIYIKTEEIDGEKKATFTTFADVDPIDAPDGLYDELNDYIIPDAKIHELSEYVEINSLQGDGTDITEAVIIFLPVDASMIIGDNASNNFNNLSFDLESRFAEQTYNFKVNKISKFFEINKK